jgi:hypothetical protein
MSSPRLGVQVLVGGADVPLGGVSTPLEVDVEYTSTQPPDYVPTPATFASSTPWPAPTGDVELDYLCLNVVARARTQKKIQLGLSGGVSVFSFEAEVSSLGFQEFWLGGHGVLFVETYEIRVESDRGSTVGANLGGEIDVRLSDRWRAFAEVRAFSSPRADLQLEPREIVIRNQARADLSLREIGSHLDLERLTVDPSFLSVSAGLRVTL